MPAQRPFGTLRSWIDFAGAGGIPIEESPVLELPGRGIAPPPTRRQGLIPRLGVIHEYTDNLFFTAQNRRADLVTVFSPGVHYILAGPRGRLEADYSFEATIYARNPELNKAVEGQAGLLSADLEITKQTRLEVAERFQVFEDPTEQAVRGILPRRGTTRQNVLEVTGVHSLTPLVDLRARYGHTLSDFDGVEGVDSLTSEGAIGLQALLSRRDRLGLEYRFRYFDFRGGRDLEAHAGVVGYDHEASETLILKGRLGAEGTRRESGRVTLLAAGSLAMSVKVATAEIGYERDFSTSGGLAQAFVSQRVFGVGQVRVTKGLRASAGLGLSIQRPLEGREGRVAVVDVHAALTYAVRPWLLLRLGYTFVRQEDITANKVTVNVVASF